MADIKPLGEIAKKYTDVTPGRSQFYIAGIARAGAQKFQQSAAAAAPAWSAGVSQAVADNRFAARVANAGAKWQRNATDKGGQRFGPGVQGAGQDYQTGFAPYHATIAGTALPPRGPRGDPGNIQRVAVLATALHTQRRQGARV